MSASAPQTPQESREPKRTGSFGKTAKRSAAWDLGSRLTIQALGFLASLVLARVLTPADFGVTSAARFFVTLATRLTQFGLNASLVRMRDIRPEHASSVLVVNVIAGIASFAALSGASGLLGGFLNSAEVGAVLPVSALVFLILPFGTVASAMMTRELRYRETNIVQIVDVVAGTLVTVALALFGFGFWSLVVGPVAGAAVATAAKLKLSPWRLSFRFSRAALSDTLSFGLGFQAKNLLIFSSTNIDNLLVGRLLGVTQLGYYDKAYGLMNQLTNRLTFDASLMRIYVLLLDQPERFRRAVRKTMTAIAVISYPILAMAIAIPDLLVLVLFGPQWWEAVEPFRILAVVGIVRASLRAAGAANEALGLVWFQTAQQLLAVLAVVAGVTVGTRWGLRGACLGVVAAVLLHALMTVGLLVRHSAVSLGDLWSALWPVGTTTCVMCLALMAGRAVLISVTQLPPFVVLPVVCLWAVLVYGLLLVWTPFSDLGEVLVETLDDVLPSLRSRVNVGVFRHR